MGYYGSGSYYAKSKTLYKCVIIANTCHSDEDIFKNSEFLKEKYID